MGAHHLVNHNGRVTEKEVEAIRASDLMKLMDVVEAATGLYNVLEQTEVAIKDGKPSAASFMKWQNLGQKLRALGLGEVKP